MTALVLDAGELLVIDVRDLLTIRAGLGLMVRAQRLNGGHAAELLLLYDQVFTAAQLRTAAVGSAAVPFEPDQPESIAEELIEVSEAAVLLGCKARNVRDRCARGSIASARRLGGRWVMDRAEIVGLAIERAERLSA